MGLVRFFSSPRKLCDPNLVHDLVGVDPGGIWVFPKIVVPQNAWFIMETSIKMDDLGVPLFLG